MAVLAVVVVAVLGVSRPAAADSDPCSDPTLQFASVQSTLQVRTQGTDWTSFTATEQITVPENWRGASGLFGDKEQQGSSLTCFLPVDQENFQSAPPSITVTVPSHTDRVAKVNVTDTMTVTDGPEQSQTWSEGFWSIAKYSWGYGISFVPEISMPASGRGPWTVTLNAPGVNILDPSILPNIDDGKGNLTWTFPSSRHALPEIDTSLESPWQVRMSLALNRWPMRWVSDSLWALGDGAVLDIVALWFSFRLLRARRDDPDGRRLPKILIFIVALSLAGYVGNAIDDYFWHQPYVDPGFLRATENLSLAVISALYFTSALQVRWVRRFAVYLGAALVSLAGSVAYPQFVPTVTPREEVFIRAVPVLQAMVLSIAGTVLWISRLWPFGAKLIPGRVRELRETPFRGKPAMLSLLVGAVMAAIVTLGQSASSSYYYWLHSHWWDTATPVFDWIEADLRNDTHWWIGDGIQWYLGFAILVGIYAILRAMNAAARGVFLGAREPYDKLVPGDAGELRLLAAATGSIFIGTWGYYAGISLPVPCFIAFAGLVIWGTTRSLSKLDWQLSKDSGRQEGARGGSALVRYRDSLLTSSVSTGTPIDSSARESGKGSAGNSNAGAVAEIGAARAILRIASGLLGGHAILASQNDNGPKANRPDVNLPESVDPGITALALGPGDTWWENGMAAVQAGKYLVAIPVVFDTYEAFSTGAVSLLGFPFGLQDTIYSIAWIIIGWVSGLFLFGALIPYLRGRRTPVKGIIFGLISFAAFASDAGIRYALNVSPYSTFITDGLMAVALFGTVGLLLDMKTVRNNKDQALINKVYRLSTVRVAVSYAMTAIVVAVGLWQAIYLTNQTTQQRLQNVSGTAQYLNNQTGAVTHP